MKKQILSASLAVLLSSPLFGFQSKEWFDAFMLNNNAYIRFVDGVVHGCCVYDGPYEAKWSSLADSVTFKNITYVPEEIAYYLPKLVALHIRDSNISTLPNVLKNLEILDLQNCPLKEIPEVVKDMNLSTLSFMDDNLKTLPDWIYKANLQRLLLTNNRLSYLDKKICNTRLISLYVLNNYFGLLPTCMNNMKLEEGVTDLTSGSQRTCAKYDIASQETIKLSTTECLIAAGWSFYALQFGYNYLDDNKTISFSPLLGDDYNISTYTWNFGDGSISHLESPTHLYSSYGDYNVTLKLTLNDANGSTLESSKLISFKERALNIKKGWNLLSVPTKDDINTSSFPSSFKFWVYQEDGNWSVNPSLIEPPKGFWINADKEFKYPYTGEPYALQNFHIKKAWNLLGSGEKISLDKNLTVWHYGSNGWYEDNRVDVGEGVWVGK